VTVLDPAASPRRKRQHGDGVGQSSEARSWAPDKSIAPPSTTPTATFRVPGGKVFRLSTDRVRARPAVSPQVSFGLGQNAIGLGLWGLLAPRGVARFLGIRAPAGVVRLLFGAREMYTGVTLASDPTRADTLWARVAGDVFDIAVLNHLNAADNPKRGNVRLALGVVLAVTALDLITAVRMSTVKRNCG
jgi:hypothetical protein